MNLLQAAEEDRQRMTSVWLARLPSVAEFMSGFDEPERWRDRPVSNLPGAYAQAASVLMEKMISLASEAPDRASALLPPYLFLRRHHFEMQLKSILKIVADNPSRWSEATGQNVASGLFKEVGKTHSLRLLWERVQPMAETVWANETHTWQLPRMMATDVSELIEQLDAIDPKGDGVRYVRDKHGNLTMLNISRVDLEHAERNMLNITEFLWWARLEIGATVINLPYEADEAEARRLVMWQAAHDQEFLV
jgi:hypothetical protein